MEGWRNPMSKEKKKDEKILWHPNLDICLFLNKG